MLDEGAGEKKKGLTKIHWKSKQGKQIDIPFLNDQCEVKSEKP